MKHTPTLKLQHYSDGQDDYIISAGDIKTADTIIKMCKPYGYRAKHIVHAVNMHEYLVESLKSAIMVLESKKINCDLLRQTLSQAERE